MDHELSNDSETPKRELRRRTTQQPYRPRPALTSSNRGKANAELRRQRELEANEIFAEANELISNMKNVVSSSGLSVSGTQEEAEEEEAEETMEVEENTHNSQEADNNDAATQGNEIGGGTQTESGEQRDMRGSEEVRDEQNVTVELGADVDLLLSSTHVCAVEEIQQQPSMMQRSSTSFPQPVDWILSSQPSGEVNTYALSEANRTRQAQTESTEESVDQLVDEVEVLPQPPTAKKARIEYVFDMDDEFDDEDDESFYEQLAASDAIDWDSKLSTTTSVTATSATGQDAESSIEVEGYDAIAKNRLAFPETNGFRWGNDKEVRVATKALQQGKDIVGKIKRETEAMENPFDFGPSPLQNEMMQSPRPPPRRMALGTISNSTLNTPMRSPSSSSIQSSNLGKRKAPTEADKTVISSTPFRPSSSLLDTPDRLAHRTAIPPTLQTPIRAGGAGRLGTTLRSTPLRSTPISSTPRSVTAGTAPQTPRISLGMTPRRAKAGTLPRFKTPFKDPSKQSQTPGSSQRLPNLANDSSTLKGVSSPSQKSSSQIDSRGAAVSTKRAIFDLNKGELQRKGYRAFGFEPESTSDSLVKQRLDAGEYDSIRQILKEPSKGRCFAFELETGYYGVSSAHAMLLEESTASGGDIPKAWVENHYILILWKLAAYTRHLLDNRYWNWAEVCRQLKYRYEREINRKQWSAIKRILRHDSPSTKAIILCVYQIPSIGDEEDEVQTLILTDGWYKIRVNVDSVLLKAIQKGRSDAIFDTKSGPVIKVGTKLAIQGAQMDTEWSNRDPIKAFEFASLSITGNSTKLARWDAKLGFVKEPFVATVRSLSAFGGNVPLMDIVITHLFPPAYTGNEDCPGYKSEPGVVAEWGEEEEQERRKAWERHQRGRAREVEEELASELEPMERILGQIEEAYEGLENYSYDDSFKAESCEEMLEAIISAGDASSYLRMTQLVPTLRSLAMKRYERLKEQKEMESINRLQMTSGTRRVRSFRMMRFRDAEPKDYNPESNSCLSDKRRKCKREVLLRFWDYEDRKNDDHRFAIRKGDHVRVANLTPTKPNAWSRMVDDRDDIHLSTNLNTKWMLFKKAAAKAEEQVRREAA